MSEAVLILGDQLSFSLSSLEAAAPDADIFMAEVADEANYVGHHKQKIVLVFSAMRHFAEKLRAQGRKVHYLAYGEHAKLTNMADVLTHICDTLEPQKIYVTEPGEYRLDSVLRGWVPPSGTALTITPDTRFIASHEAFAQWAEGRKQLRMEYFYRDLRRQTDILMQDGEPLGGQWNYDAENRKKLPADQIVPPRPRRHCHHPRRRCRLRRAATSPRSSARRTSPLRPSPSRQSSTHRRNPPAAPPRGLPQPTCTTRRSSRSSCARPT